MSSPEISCLLVCNNFEVLHQAEIPNQCDILIGAPLDSGYYPHFSTCPRTSRPKNGCAVPPPSGSAECVG